MTFRVSELRGYEVLDSRGLPTVAVTCTLTSGSSGFASVPSGRSTGEAEALELRDGDANRYHGMGCLRAAAALSDTLLPALVGQEFVDQAALDNRLIEVAAQVGEQAVGANSVLGASLAFARAAAMQSRTSLVDYLAGDRIAREMPRPMINLFSGGLHGGAGVELQDLLVVPLTASSTVEALEMMATVYAVAERRAERRFGMRPHRADEGGLAPAFTFNREVFDFAVECFDLAGFRSGVDVGIAIDVAATHFVDGSNYVVDGHLISSGELIELIAGWAADYPIVSVEDGLAEDDPAWPALREALPAGCWVVGDDLLCTQVALVRDAIDRRAADALLLKVNQVGTLTQAAAAMAEARSAGWAVVASARSGETEDDWLADLAVAWGADSIKIGSVRQSDRLSKYNRLLVLEAQNRWLMTAWPALQSR